MVFRPRLVRAELRRSSCPTRWKLLMASTWIWTSSSMSMTLKKETPSNGSTFSAGSRVHLNSAPCPGISAFLAMESGLSPKKRTARGLGRPPSAPSPNHEWQKFSRFLTSEQVRGLVAPRAAGLQSAQEAASFQPSPETKPRKVKGRPFWVKLVQICSEPPVCRLLCSNAKHPIRVVQIAPWEPRRVGQQRTCSVLHQTSQRDAAFPRIAQDFTSRSLWR